MFRVFLYFFDAIFNFVTMIDMNVSEVRVTSFFGFIYPDDLVKKFLDAFSSFKDGRNHGYAQ